MDATRLRDRFRQFVGDDETYRRFIKTCVDAPSSRKRLRNWQEPIWTIFVNDSLEYESLSASVVLEAFYVCHLHLIPLSRQTIHIPAKLVITTVSSGDPKAPYGYRHPFSMSESNETRELQLDVCGKCLAITDPGARVK